MECTAFFHFSGEINSSCANKILIVKRKLSKFCASDRMAPLRYAHKIGSVKMVAIKEKVIWQNSAN